jgi:hypothetical protein
MNRQRRSNATAGDAFISTSVHNYANGLSEKQTIPKRGVLVPVPGRPLELSK